MQLHGIHHLNAVTANIPGNQYFYTCVLGMRLVKKTVNQDDVSAYHLFYADGAASPGTDLTFFDWPVDRERRGTNAIVRTALRVNGQAALDHCAGRLDVAGIAHSPIHTADGRLQLSFENLEGQRLALMDDGGAGLSHPWDQSPVPEVFQIRGLGPITLSVPDLAPTGRFLEDAMRQARSFAAADALGMTVHVCEMGESGATAELHVRVEPGLLRAHQVAGSMHHVAFRVRDEEYGYWTERLQHLRIRSSGPVDRFYFRSLYMREPDGILYEIATDGPGFATDEPMETLGKSLSLPPFLEPQCAVIERGLNELARANDHPVACVLRQK